MPSPSIDKTAPQFEQVIAEAGRVTAAYLNDAEQRQLMAMFRLALTDTDRQMVMAEDGIAYVKTGDIPKGTKPNQFTSAADNYGYALGIMKKDGTRQLNTKGNAFVEDLDKALHFGGELALDLGQHGSHLVAET